MDRNHHGVECVDFSDMTVRALSRDTVLPEETRGVALSILPRASLDVKRGAHSGLEFVRKVLCAKVRGRPGTHFCARHLLYINESAKCTTSFVHARARTKLVVHFADAFLYNKCRAQKCATFVVHFADAFLYNKCRAQKEPLANICMSVDSQVCFFNTQAHGTAYNKQKQG